MRKRKRKDNAHNETSPTNTTHAPALTLDAIRERAHQIFLARGGTPGNELDDWLLAEQELTRERAQANRPREDL